MSELFQLEQQAEEFKILLARRECLLRLTQNPDYKKIINDYFLVQECARYAQLSADPAMDAQQRADCLGIAQAAGHFKRWVSAQFQMSNYAETHQAELDEQILAARQEEGE